MELTLESAFSTGGIVGHTSYLLLVFSMLMRRLSLLRMFVIASSLIGIFYEFVWLKDPVGVFWESMLVTVNVVQLAIVYTESRRAKFSPEERAFSDLKLPDLEPAYCRRLLNQGLWVTGNKGTVLTQQGEPVSHLYYLADGEVVIYSGGHPVASCGAGSFIGEMTVMDGEPATGTAVLTETSRYWMIEASALRKLAHSKPDIDRALGSSFTAGMKQKLVHSNKLIAETMGNEPG